jgi:hypothetical protein
MSKPMIAVAVVVVLAIILVVFRLRNRGPRPEESAEFRRQLLYASFGRGMVDAMSSSESPSPPWSAFVTVKDRLRMRDQVLAREDLHRIVESSDAATLVRLIGWNLLREIGENPDASVSQTIQGVVVELPGQGVPEVVAVYADGSAGQLDPSGNLTQWTPSGAAAAMLSRQIDDAQKLVADFTPAGGLPAPARSSPRITLLTFAGLRSKEIGPGMSDDAAITAIVDRAKAIQAATSATSR